MLASNSKFKLKCVLLKIQHCLHSKIWFLLGQSLIFPFSTGNTLFYAHQPQHCKKKKINEHRKTTKVFFFFLTQKKILFYEIAQFFLNNILLTLTLPYSKLLYYYKYHTTYKIQLHYYKIYIICTERNCIKKKEKAQKFRNRSTHLGILNYFLHILVARKQCSIDVSHQESQERSWSHFL